ncbi:MAG: serine/threonine protein kinase, partial [Alphaproteobacteria bacterium]|nr:serine/threonine protein kinase [Alphaproteobacteria bacterium]
MHDVALGPYLLHEPIGRGASGVVWRAVHASQGLAVAVKVLQGAGARALGAEEAVRAEVETVAALSHPGIVLLFDQGEVNAATAAASRGALEAGQPYLAMELCSGGSLAQLGPDFGWREVAATVRGLLDALAHAHARGVVHRDLKPSNVLVAGPEDLRPGLKLTDFGVAWSLGDRRVRSVTGTPRYMAPEQFRGDARDLGAWTDLYALGCMI